MVLLLYTVKTEEINSEQEDKYENIAQKGAERKKWEMREKFKRSLKDNKDKIRLHVH